MQDCTWTWRLSRNAIGVFQSIVDEDSSEKDDPCLAKIATSENKKRTDREDIHLENAFHSKSVLGTRHPNPFSIQNVLFHKKFNNKKNV